MPLCSSLLLEVQPRQEIAGGCEYGVHRPLQGVRCAAIRILAYGDLWCVLRGAPNSVRNSPSFLLPSLSTGFFDAELYWWRSHWCFRYALEWCLEASGGFRHFLARVRVLRPGLFLLFYVFFYVLVCQNFEVLSFSLIPLWQGQLSRFFFWECFGACGV